MFANNIQKGHTIFPVRKADDPHTGMFEARFLRSIYGYVSIWSAVEHYRGDSIRRCQQLVDRIMLSLRNTSVYSRKCK